MTRSQRPLSNLQRVTLDAMSRKWAIAPGGTSSQTLLSLQERGLIEGRRDPRATSLSDQSYTSNSYRWRRK